MKMGMRVAGLALLLGVWFGPLAAQEAPDTELARIQQTDEEADRAALTEFFARPEVQRAAKVGGIDLDQARERVATLEGAPLHRAAQQARTLDSRLAAQGEIRISTITLIIILLLVVIIILIA